MELERLKRCLTNLDNHNICIKGLITDRHGQIKKYTREEHPEVEHQFDVWHVGKGKHNIIMKIKDFNCIKIHVVQPSCLPSFR